MSVDIIRSFKELHIASYLCSSAAFDRLISDLRVWFPPADFLLIQSRVRLPRSINPGNFSSDSTQVWKLRNGMCHRTLLIHDGVLVLRYETVSPTGGHANDGVHRLPLCAAAATKVTFPTVSWVGNTAIPSFCGLFVYSKNPSFTYLFNFPGKYFPCATWFRQNNAAGSAGKPGHFIYRYDKQQNTQLFGFGDDSNFLLPSFSGQFGQLNDEKW